MFLVTKGGSIASEKAIVVQVVDETKGDEEDEEKSQQDLAV